MVENISVRRRSRCVPLRKNQSGRWWESVERVFVQRVVPLTCRRAQAVFFTPPTRVKLRFCTALKHEIGRRCKTDVSLSFSLLSLISRVQFAGGVLIKGKRINECIENEQRRRLRFHKSS